MRTNILHFHTYFIPVNLFTRTPFLSAHLHVYIQDSSWPVLCHGLSMLFAMLSVSRGVSTIEPVNKVVVPILLFIVVFCFYWALFLPYSADGIIHMFSPSWSECTAWLSCDCLMAVTWLSCDSLMAVTWLACDCLMAVTWLACDCLMAVTWLACDWHLCKGRT